MHRRFLNRSVQIRPKSGGVFVQVIFLTAPYTILGTAPKYVERICRVLRREYRIILCVQKSQPVSRHLCYLQFGHLIFFGFRHSSFGFVPRISAQNLRVRARITSHILVLRCLPGKARGLRILLWKGRATPPGWMDRRPNMESYSCVNPLIHPLSKNLPATIGKTRWREQAIEEENVCGDFSANIDHVAANTPDVLSHNSQYESAIDQYLNR